MDTLDRENQAWFINKVKELVLNLILTGLRLIIRITWSLWGVLALSTLIPEWGKRQRWADLGV